MVTYREFVDIYAEKCGGGVTDSAPVWNRNKDAISDMTRSEVFDALEC